MPPAPDIANELRAMSARVEELRSLFAVQAAASAEMPPSSSERLFQSARVIHDTATIPRKGCIWWPYDLAIDPIPDGWEEATEMRGLYACHVDPDDDDLDVPGYGLNTNSFTGFSKHGPTENNHATHRHEPPGFTVTFPSITTDTDFFFTSTAPGAGYEEKTIIIALGDPVITYDDPPADACPTGGMEWCDTEADTDNRPPTFLGYWIRRL